MALPALTRCRHRGLVRLLTANISTVTKSQFRSLSSLLKNTTDKTVSVTKYSRLPVWHSQQSCGISSVSDTLPPEDPTELYDLVPPEVPFEDPVKGKLVYYGFLSKQVRGVKMFSLSTTLIAGGLQPYFYLHASEINPAFKFVMSGMMTVIMFGTPILIHLITRSHVVNLYYNKQTQVFTALTYNIFIRPKIWKFKAEDVTIPDVPGPFTSLKVNGKSLNIDQTTFLSREVFCKLYKLDKLTDEELYGKDGATQQHTDSPP